MLYRFCYVFFSFFYKLFYEHTVIGHHNLEKCDQGLIIAPNHASYFDPPLVGISCTDPVYFLAKYRLFKNSFIRWLFYQLHAYPIGGKTSDAESFKEAKNLIDSGKKIVIFPEGTRTFDGQLRTFQKGLAMLAIKFNCPIVPTYIHSTFTLWPRNKLFPKLHGKTTCIFGKPIDPTPYLSMPKRQGQQELTQAVEKSIRKLKEEYQKEHLSKRI